MIKRYKLLIRVWISWSARCAWQTTPRMTF